MKVRVFCLFLLLLTGLQAMGQVGGEAVYNFLNISTSARQTALGGKVLTLLDDVNQPIWNPATINSELQNQFSVNYSSYLADINIGSVAYARALSKETASTIFASVQYINYGTLIGADENGVETGNFSASDIAISMGYARALPWPDFYAGASVKLINSVIDSYTSFGIAADLGFSYYNIDKPYRITLVFRNMGTQLKSFNGVKEKLPFEIALGGSYQLENVPLRWYATLDNLQQWDVSVSNPSNQITDINGTISDENISFANNAMRHLSLGLELFPERPINLRLGYNFRRAKELELQNVRTFGGLSFGFGVKVKTFRLNYAFSKVHTASNVSTFSIQIDLDKH